MRRRRLALAVLACVLLVATGLRVAAGAEKRVLTHDESISYLAAACHQGDYARLTTRAEPPFGRWVGAEEWKALLRPDRPLCLEQIAADLAREDIHPPLYFWLLHGWALVFGVGLWTGVSLNIALAALTGLALFALARRVLGDPLEAALVAGVWSLGPAAIRVFAEARQYELLALLAVLFVWQCLRFCDPPTRSPRRDAALLAAAAAAGALTHFLFALVAAAGAGILVARLWRSHRGLLAWGVASIVAGYAAFSLLHPGFALSLARGSGQGAAPALDRLIGRIELTVDTLAELVLPPALARGPAAYVACATVLALTAFVLPRGLRSGTARLDSDGMGRTRFRALVMPLVFVWLLGAHALLFLAFISPGGAMASKHLSAVWPFAAFVPVLALEALPRRVRAPAAVAGGAALAAAGAIALLGQPPRTAPAPALERARGVVLDNVARGVLPRVVWRLPDDARVYAADQRHLLERPGEWVPELERGDLYVGGLPASDPRYGNSAERGRRVAAAIGRHHRLVPVPEPFERARVYWIGDPLRTTRRLSAPPPPARV
jgi:Dolichyl-phosphate-mannose-protein mannosyltransferase